MAAYVYLRELAFKCCNFSNKQLNNIYSRIFKEPPFGQLPAICGIPNQVLPEENVDNGIVWGVPKGRRSIEQRWKRRYGIADSFERRFKFNLVVCDECGHHHIAHTICGNCYERVKQETEFLRDSIQEKLGLAPVEKEVSICYTDDPIRKDVPPNLMTVEIPKQRPSWFTKGLLSRVVHKPTTQPLLPGNIPISESTDK